MSTPDCFRSATSALIPSDVLGWEPLLCSGRRCQSRRSPQTSMPIALWYKSTLSMTPPCNSADSCRVRATIRVLERKTARGSFCYGTVCQTKAGTGSLAAPQQPQENNTQGWDEHSESQHFSRNRI